MQFYQLATGAKFFVNGQRFTKVAMGCAEDENRMGCAFTGAHDVEPDGESLLLPPEVAAKWKPDEGDWTRRLPRAPGYIPENE
jgi:hypothetical protein